MGEIDVQVAVVGASLAGAALALRLGRAGIAVALIDREQFPRSKACGEGIALRGVEALGALGLNATELEHTPLYGYHLLGPGRELRVKSGERPTALGIRRSVLDAALIERVRCMGTVSLLLGERVEVTESVPAGVIVRTARHRVKAQFVVYAAGAGALPIEVRNRARRRCGVTVRVSLDRAHQLSMVAIEGRRGAELYLTPTGPRTLNLTLLGERERVKAAMADGMPTLWRPVLSRLGVLSAVASDLARCEPEGAGCISGFRGDAYRGAELWIGDAVETLDPCGGAGMSHALLSAAYAAQALIEILLERHDPELACARYAKRRERETRALRGHTAVVRAALSLIHRGALALPGAGMLGSALLRASHVTPPRSLAVTQLYRAIGACAGWGGVSARVLN